MPRQWRRSGEPWKSCASSANLFAFTCGPPWAWINGSAVLTELDVEHGLAYVSRDDGRDLGCCPHRRDRFSRKNELADVNRNALHPGDQHMIPASGIEDQELSVASKWSRVNDPAITRGCNLGSSPRFQRNASFDATYAIGSTKSANLEPINRHRE